VTDPARIRRTLTRLADAHTRDHQAIDAQLERLYAALSRTGTRPSRRPRRRHPHPRLAR
jgi:hypothetical protein